VARFRPVVDRFRAVDARFRPVEVARLRAVVERFRVVALLRFRAVPARDVDLRADDRAVVDFDRVLRAREAALRVVPEALRRVDDFRVREPAERALPPEVERPLVGRSPGSSS